MITPGGHDIDRDRSRRLIHRSIGSTSTGRSADLATVLSVDTLRSQLLYAETVRDAVRALWAEPRVPNPPRRVWRDWALVGVLLPAAVLEAIFRDDLEWRPFGLVLCGVAAFGLLWRRTHPLLVVLVVFGAQTLADISPLFGTNDSTVLYASAYVLLLPYALFRWGSGRDAAIGISFILVAHVFRETVNSTGTDVLVGMPFFIVPAVLGAAIRYEASSRFRRVEQVKSREREQLARELHDTVAHHVSAIAIQAQAGRTLAASNPEAAVDALEVIEEAASRTLAEMRLMVRALRDEEEPDLTPQRGVQDIEGLAGTLAETPRVAVELSGDLGHLRPAVDAALYRLAQESITNAVRHARHATRIDVRVDGEQDSVRLTVTDDGEPAPVGTGSSWGYGLVGMTERAKLLGGTLEAGPATDHGWKIVALLPRNGAAA